jgi:hypothetical protein
MLREANVVGHAQIAAFQHEALSASDTATSVEQSSQGWIPCLSEIPVRSRAQPAACSAAGRAERSDGHADENGAEADHRLYYRISLDTSTPFRICGGLQDNANWLGPSATRTKEGILNSDWINIYGGDGFGCAFDSADPNIVYAESQSADFYRLDLNSGQVKMLRPAPAEGQVGFRFNWDSPLVASQHHKGTIYLGGNRIFALTNRAENWKAISPGLSAQEPSRIMTAGSGAETYGVVFTIAESPAQANLLWAGTDDGKAWITQDERGTWTDLTPNLPAAVKGLWMSRLAASHFDRKVAYLAVGGYRSGNYAPLAYRTADSRRTWHSIAGNLPADNPVHFVYEDPKNANLLIGGHGNRTVPELRPRRILGEVPGPAHRDGGRPGDSPA